MSTSVLEMLDMSSPDLKRAAYAGLNQQLQALLVGERDMVANLAQFSALVYQCVPGLNWAGFYLLHGTTLVLDIAHGVVRAKDRPRHAVSDLARSGR